MWRSSRFLLRTLTSSVCRGTASPAAACLRPGTAFLSGHASRAEEPGSSGLRCENDWKGDILLAKKILRIADVVALKKRLEMEDDEVICFSELIKTCESMGVANSAEEAAAFAKVLEDAGDLLLIGDKVYLHPERVVDPVREAVAPILEPKLEELKNLKEEKVEIDMLAHKQVRWIACGGLGVLVVQFGLFFRLTFWEFSWDVMEPIAFFVTSSGLILGYAFFLITSRDPSNQGFMKRLFLSRQRKLFDKRKFDMNRYKELQKLCKLPLHNSEGGEVERIYKD